MIIPRGIIQTYKLVTEEEYEEFIKWKKEEK